MARRTETRGGPSDRRPCPPCRGRETACRPGAVAEMADALLVNQTAPTKRRSAINPDVLALVARATEWPRQMGEGAITYAKAVQFRAKPSLSAYYRARMLSRQCRGIDTMRHSGYLSECRH